MKPKPCSSQSVYRIVCLSENRVMDLPAHLNPWAVRPFSAARQVRILRKLVVTDWRLALWASCSLPSLDGADRSNTPSRAGAALPGASSSFCGGLCAPTAFLRDSTHSLASRWSSAHSLSISLGKTIWMQNPLSVHGSSFSRSRSCCTAMQEAREYWRTGWKTVPHPSVGKAWSVDVVRANVNVSQLFWSISRWSTPALRMPWQCCVNKGSVVGLHKLWAFSCSEVEMSHSPSGPDGEGDEEGDMGTGNLVTCWSSTPELYWQFFCLTGLAACTFSKISCLHSMASHLLNALSWRHMLSKNKAWSVRWSGGWGICPCWLHGAGKTTLWQCDRE